MSHNGVRDQRRGGRRTVDGRQVQRRRTRPTVVALEDRRLMSTFTVTNTTDSGPGSLRYEIDAANSNTGASTIDFDSTVFNAPLTITLTGSPLELKNSSGAETIMGPASGVTVSGAGLSRVFQVDANVTASISGLTITGGSASAPGGGLANYSVRRHAELLYRQRELGRERRRCVHQRLRHDHAGQLHHQR